MFNLLEMQHVILHFVKDAFLPFCLIYTKLKTLRTQKSAQK